MLDKAIPYFDILMARPGDAEPFRAQVPAGYSIVSYSAGDERDWARIVTSVGEFDDEIAALRYFEKTFLPHSEALRARCLFAVHPDGEKIGTITAWWDEIGGETVPLLHWLAVCPRAQRNGIATALTARCLEILQTNHPDKTAYLHTQTWSHVAVRLYQKAGFSMVRETPTGQKNDYEQAQYILDCVQNGGVTYEKLLNQPVEKDRLCALKNPAPQMPPLSEFYVNNHIHTTYSFSPYSPALAVYRARAAGLPTAGIMDHDSVAGAAEFKTAGEWLGVATTTGVECRVSLDGTPFADRHINNPDQKGNAYLAMHGIPEPSLPMVERFLSPIRQARGLRNRAMTEKLNAILEAVGVAIDYDADVLPLSQAHNMGSVTERHICCAAALALIARHGKELPGALEKLDIRPNEKTLALIKDAQNPFRTYDLLGLLKSDLVSRFYLPATDECPPIADFVALCHEAGAIAAYPYLGDVGESVTGDKKAQVFEDAFLDELFSFLKSLGFDAITYMPTRNTPAQLARVQALCARHQFFEISGEDINSPRQSFLCAALEQPEFAHLRRATYALIGHERAASADIARGMFSDWAKNTYPDLKERTTYFAEIVK